MPYRLFWLVGLLLASVQAQPRTCALSSVPVTLRAQGLSELVGDIVIACSGGVPTPIGGAIPLFTVQATLPTQAGSRMLVGGYTDALLLAGEPDALQQLPCTADPCGAVAGSGLNRNVYQGRLTTPNTISWTVPLDGGPQTLRLVNLRISGGPVAGFTPTIAVSITGPASVNVTPASIAVAQTPTASLEFAVRSPDNATAGVARLDKSAITNFPLGPGLDFQFNLRFSEAAVYGFRSRSVTATSDNPNAVATQARPGQLAEPRFQMSETGYYNQAFPAINGLSAAGLADSGTRLIARFANIPPGASLYVGTVPTAEYSSAGVTARLLTTDATGVGPFVLATPAGSVRSGAVPVALLPVVNGQATAVWEVLDPTVNLDRLSFGAFLSYGAPVADATVTVQAMFGPASPSGTLSSAPRFTSSQNPVNAVVIGAGGGGVTPGPGGPLTITSAVALPAGVAGQAYPPFVLSATPATAGLTWSVIEGTFPPGMTLSSTGLIGGAPVFPGTYSFTVRAQALFNEAATARLTIFVRPSQLTATSVGTVNGIVGTAIAPLALTAVGGNPPLRWSAPPTNFPPGLSLTENGIVSGVPTLEGFFSVPLFVQDATGSATSVTATFVVRGLLRIITPSPLPLTTAASPYRALLEAAGGSPPYVWSIASGALPLGLLLDSSGSIAGAPLTATRGSLMLEVTDADGRKSARPFTVETAGSMAGLARIRPSPEGFVFAFTPDAAPRTQLLRLVGESIPATPVSLSVSTENGGNWLTVDRNEIAVSASNAAMASVQANPRGLAPGSYSGFVMLSSGDSLRSLPVTMMVSATPALTVAPAGLVFTAGEGAPSPARQRIYTLSPGSQAAVGWRASTSSPWLRLSAASGTATDLRPGFFDLEAVTANLAPGEYWGEVQVAADGSAPQSVVAVLRVLPAGIIPPVSLSTAALLVTPGAPSPGFALANPYRAAVTYFTSRDFGADAFSWFSLNPLSATLEAGAGQAVTVETRPSLDAGVRRGAITVSFAGGAPRTVEITAIQPPANCQPRRLAPVLASPGLDQNLTLGWPVTVEARVADDCGQLLASGAVTLSTPDGGVPLLPLGDGRWLGTWTPAANAVAPGSAPLTLAARSTNGSLEGTSASTVALVEGGQLSVNAVVSSGTFSRYRPVAPGGFVTVLGFALTGRPGAAPEVTLGGQRLDVVFSSATQLNAFIPAAIPAGQVLPLVVRRDAQLSVPAAVPVARTAPDIFVVTDQEFRLLDPGRPVAPGDVIVIFCTGLGAVAASGSVAAPVTVAVGGAPAEFLGAAGAPGFPGLYQVAARLGALTPARSDNLILVTADGRPSPAVPLALRR